MAEISDSGGGKKKGGKVRAKKMSTKIDFTPMVDLGFLLITFFMLTTTLLKPQTMKITMPEKDQIQDSTKIKESTAMTVILSERNRIYYYFGITDPQVEITNYDATKGIRKVLKEKNKRNIDQIDALRAKVAKKQITQEQYKEEVGKINADRNSLMVLVKADDKATYKNLIDMLDELKINDVGKYAIVDITDAEKELLAAAEANAQ
ncbi:MAG: biopolymer transporter ExbD [Chitinophagales bacterium]|nr:biopolymer transporter ExbD [Chitinophagales bacterium]